MYNKKKKKEQASADVEKQLKEAMGKPWLSMKTGLWIMTFTSIGMAVLTAVQIYPARGLWEAILWGLGFGAFIWVVFYGFYFFRKLFK